MTLLAGLLFAWLLSLAWRRRIHPPRWIAPWCFYANNGFIGAIIGVIVSVISSVVQTVMTVGNFIWNGLNDALSGLSRGLTWLWKGVSDIWKSVGGFLKHVFNDVIGNWLKTIYNAYLKLEGWLSKVFGPIIKWFNKVVKWWDTYIQPYVRKVLNIIQRVRLALKVLTAFHIKWAQQLDHDLAVIQEQIIKNDLMIYGWLREAANILNDLVNPLHILRNNVMVQSVIAAIDDLSIALTGQKWGALLNFEGLISGGVGVTASLKQQMQVGAQDVFGKTGDAGRIIDQAPELRNSLFKEMGLGTSVVNLG